MIYCEKQQAEEHDGDGEVGGGRHMRLHGAEVHFTPRRAAAFEGGDASMVQRCESAIHRARDWPAGSSGTSLADLGGWAFAAFGLPEPNKVSGQCVCGRWHSHAVTAALWLWLRRKAAWTGECLRKFLSTQSATAPNAHPILASSEQCHEAAAYRCGALNSYENQFWCRGDPECVHRLRQFLPFARRKLRLRYVRQQYNQAEHRYIRLMLASPWRHAESEGSFDDVIAKLSCMRVTPNASHF